MKTNIKTMKSRYCWVIVVVCFILVAFMWPLMMSCFGTFIPEIQAATGWTRSSISLCSAVVAIAAMVFSPITAKLFNKYDARIVIVGCILVVSIGFLLYSLATSILILYCGAACVGIGLAGSSMMAVSVLIKNWFVAKRGLITSIALAGSGLGGMIFNPIINHFLGVYTWHTVYRAIAIVVLILIPIVIIFIRTNPSDKGLLPYGAEEETEAEQNKAWGLTVKESRKTAFFWAYALGCLLMSLIIGGVLMQANSYLRDINYDRTYIAFVMGVSLALAVPGKIVLGFIFDKKGSNAGVWFGLGAFIICIIGLIFAESPIMLWVFSIFHGFGTSSATIFVSVLTMRIFGTIDFTTAYGRMNLFSQMGLAIGFPLLPFIAEKSGGYLVTWIFCLILAVASMMLFFYSIRSSKKLLLEKGETPLQ